MNKRDRHKGLREENLR